MNIRIAVIIIASLLPFAAYAQQVADTLYNPPIPHPKHLKGKGPIILVDEAHHNFHTRDGRYKPFANVLTKDGYVVERHTTTFSKTSLEAGNILVIANALHESNASQWTLPTPSAFTDDEIVILNEWVSNGGALLLIADHMPFPGAAEKLAASFGFKFVNGFAMGNDVFKRNDGLQVNTITTGTSPTEVVQSIRTFTGAAFEIPQGALPILSLNKKHDIKIPETAWEFNNKTTVISGEGLYQGAFLVYGKGRIVVFGEAAMFTAQLHGKNKMGMNSSDAKENLQLLLNVIHWLEGGK